MIFDDDLGGIAGWATGLMDRFGAAGAGLATALENLFPPLPSEIILPLAGFTASRGEMTLAGALFWTTLGSVVGAMALYLIGVVLGRDRIRAVAARLPLVDVADIDRTEAWFARHGRKAVFFGRMIPIFRSLISIPAGIERMSIPVFLLYTAFGSLIWNSVLVLAGYFLGENWDLVESYVGVLTKVVVAVVAVAVVWFAVSRLRRRGRHERRGGRSGDGGSARDGRDSAEPRGRDAQEPYGRDAHERHGRERAEHERRDGGPYGHRPPYRHEHHAGGGRPPYRHDRPPYHHEHHADRGRRPEAPRDSPDGDRYGPGDRAHVRWEDRAGGYDR